MFRTLSRAYFRIQGKRPTCSERASYLGNTSWPDSPKLMKILVTIGLNRLFSLHITFWYITIYTVYYFLLETLRMPDDVRNRNFEIFYSFFFQETHRYHHWIEKSMKKIFKEFCKGLPTMVGQQRKICSLKSLKRLFHHSMNLSFWKW